MSDEKGVNETYVTKREFAALIGISERALYNWFASGVLIEGGSVGEWIRAYTGHLRQTIAIRTGKPCDI